MTHIIKCFKEKGQGGERIQNQAKILRIRGGIFSWKRENLEIRDLDLCISEELLEEEFTLSMWSQRADNREEL